MNAFPFLDLPAELRKMILVQCIGEEIFPEILKDTYGSRLHFGTGMCNSDGNWVDSPNYTLMLTNKQIHGEWLDAALTGTTKCFFELEMLREVLDYVEYYPQPNFPVPKQFLQSVKLAFPHQFYLIFFKADMEDIRPAPGDEWDEAYDGIERCYAEDIIPRMMALGVKNLTVDFRSQKFAFNNDPWLAKPLFPTVLDLSISYIPSCQKAITEWILEWGKQWLIRIPHVTVSGYVKNSTKKNWNEIFKQERAGHSQPDNLATLRALQAPSLPPACCCTTNCFFDGLERIWHNEIAAELKWFGYDVDELWDSDVCHATMDEFEFDYND